MSQKKPQKQWKIGVLAGDGIGPEIMRATLPVIEEAARLGGHDMAFHEAQVGWAAYDKYESVMPQETWALLRKMDSFLFGAVGLPGRDNELPLEKRPERGALLPLRKNFGLAVNIRPVKIHRGLGGLSPLKAHLVKDGVDVTFFRELLGDMYFGKKHVAKDGSYAMDQCRYTKKQIETIARAAFEYAQKTGKTVTSLDKANVLVALGTFWRDTVQDLRDREFPGVNLVHQYVDSMALALITKPRSFEIVLAGNMFGDIASDEGSGIPGSLGFMPSASINPKNNFGMYEPGGGSAPDIAGKNIANPIAMILSGAMMFEHTLKDPKTARRIENAVRQTLLLDGIRTKDVYRPQGDRKLQTLVGTREMAQAILERLK